MGICHLLERKDTIDHGFQLLVFESIKDEGDRFGISYGIVGLGLGEFFGPIRQFKQGIAANA
jgi:hypothetical protein